MFSHSRDDAQHNLFLAHFDQILNPRHPLVVLANKIDWARFDATLQECYSPDFGRPAKNVRLMVGLLYLKHAFNVSDEDLPRRWVENPYWQYFCGYSYMQHEPPIDATTLVKWRRRAGAERLELLLKETVDLAVREKHVLSRELSQVNIDTTVQEKNITYPTDAKLAHRAIEKLGALAKRRGIVLRQSYVRVAKHLTMQIGRYAHAKQFKRMRRGLKKLKTYLGRLIRDVRRKMTEPHRSLKNLLALCERVHGQKPEDKNKLYSLHEPEVRCISKGKARMRYEFGQKALVATTNRKNWIVGAKSLPENPYDGHSLAESARHVEGITSVALSAMFVDQGYRGHDYEGPATVHLCGRGSRSESGVLRKRKRRRSAVEPKIGHLKSESRLGRNFLRGLMGDAINVVLAAAGSNFRKLLACIFGLLALCRLLTRAWRGGNFCWFRVFGTPNLCLACAVR